MLSKHPKTEALFILPMAVSLVQRSQLSKYVLKSIRWMMAVLGQNQFCDNHDDKQNRLSHH